MQFLNWDKQSLHSTRTSRDPINTDLFFGADFICIS